VIEPKNGNSSQKNKKPLTTETQRHREKTKERKTKDFLISNELQLLSGQ
jgi:hypothetical protein